METRCSPSWGVWSEHKWAVTLLPLRDERLNGCRALLVWKHSGTTWERNQTWILVSLLNPLLNFVNFSSVVFSAPFRAKKRCRIIYRPLRSGRSSLNHSKRHLASTNATVPITSEVHELPVAPGRYQAQDTRWGGPLLQASTVLLKSFCIPSRGRWHM